MMRSKLLLGEWLNLAFWVHFATRLLTTVMRRSTYMHMFVFFFFCFFLAPLPSHFAYRQTKMHALLSTRITSLH